MTAPSAERTLWLAVLGDQLTLACRERDPLGIGGDPASARRWIGTRSFRLVCAYAGLDPDFVLRWVENQLALPVEARHLERGNLRSVASRAQNLRLPLRARRSPGDAHAA